MQQAFQKRAVLADSEVKPKYCVVEEGRRLAAVLQAVVSKRRGDSSTINVGISCSSSAAEQLIPTLMVLLWNAVFYAHTFCGPYVSVTKELCFFRTVLEQELLGRARIGDNATNGGGKKKVGGRAASALGGA